MKIIIKLLMNQKKKNMKKNIRRVYKINNMDDY